MNGAKAVFVQPHLPERKGCSAVLSIFWQQALASLDGTLAKRGHLEAVLNDEN
jgi:hypothetical protein